LFDGSPHISRHTAIAVIKENAGCWGRLSDKQRCDFRWTEAPSRLLNWFGVHKTFLLVERRNSGNSGQVELSQGTPDRRQLLRQPLVCRYCKLVGLEPRSINLCVASAATSHNFYWVKAAVNALAPGESKGDGHALVLLLFFVTSVAVFGSRIRFLP